MSTRAMDCAAYLVNYAKKNGNPVSNLQLQKMLFFAQVDYMTRHAGQKLFTDKIYAWQYGPVIPYVYSAYSRYGGSPILQPVASPQGDLADAEDFQKRADSLDADKQGSLTSVYDTWANRPVWAIVAESHKPGKAWDRAYNRDGVACSGYGDVIDDDLIMATYGN